MADNYLEKRMDDYARGKLGSRRAASRGLQCVKIPALRVLFVNADGRELLVKALCEAGYKVAFTLSDPGEGNRMAQATGGRFYPADAAAAYSQLVAAGDRPAAVIAPSAKDLPSQLSPSADDGNPEVRTVLLDSSILAGQAPHVVALLLIAMLHPDYVD